MCTAQAHAFNPLHVIASVDQRYVAIALELEVEFSVVIASKTSFGLCTSKTSFGLCTSKTSFDCAEGCAHYFG